MLFRRVGLGELQLLALFIPCFVKLVAQGGKRSGHEKAQKSQKRGTGFSDLLRVLGLFVAKPWFIEFCAPPGCGAVGAPLNRPWLFLR